MSTPGAPSSSPASGLLTPARPPAVLVVGAQRSGLSLVASALESLGLNTPLAAAGPDGEPGRQAGDPVRSISLTKSSDEILRRLGGSWDDPPALPHLPAEPPAPPELRASLRVASSVFGAAFGDPAGPVCWADSRTSLLLPFWRHVLARSRPLAAVLCIRQPLPAARSLDRATGTGLPVALALWERYTRSAVEGLAGLPVFVSVLNGMLDDPDRWQATMVQWLGSLEVAVPRGAGAAPKRPSGATPGEAAGGRDDSIVLPSQQRLHDELAALSGSHTSFAYTPSVGESPWSANVLEQRRDQNRFWRASDWLAKELIRATPRRGRPEGVRQAGYPPNATTDLPGYHRFLRERGESITLPGASLVTVPARRGRRSPAPDEAAALQRRRAGKRGFPREDRLLPVVRALPAIFRLRAVHLR